MDADDERELEKLKRDRKRAEKKDNLKEVAQICNCIGELLAKHGRWEEAISEHETELGLSEALNDTIGSAVASRKLGECYCGLEKYEKALQLQQRHLSLAVACKDAVEEQRAWATIGRTYLFHCDTAKSKDEFNFVSRKAEDAFKKSLEVCERLKANIKNVEYMEMKARLFLNLGLVFDGRCDLKQCAEYMKQAIKISEQHNLHSDLYRCQFSLATIYQRGGNLTQALQHLDSALQCAQKLKDKFLESEILTTKALVKIQLGDYYHSKHYLKKAHKLGTPTTEESDRIVKLFKAVSKLEEASALLDKTSIGDIERLKIFERLGDGSADAGNYKQAIKFYLSMLKCAEDANKPGKDLVPIYISLAQTYIDDKQYDKAMEYYKKEIAARQDNEFEQICRTWLNIAECQEQSGLGYDVICKSCLAAYECAKKSENRKLQLYVLKSLIEMQKAFNQKSHQQQTEKKLKHLEDKYKISRDEELSEEDRGAQESDDEDDNLSIGELTESESSGDEEKSNTKDQQIGGARCRRNLQIKRNEKGETPLHRACIEGNLKKVKKFLEQGHPVNTRDYCGWTPLHEASNHDFYDIVAILLDHGADLNDRGGKECGGVTPLIDAASCGNLEIMDLLIARGANIIAKDDEGNTALDSLKAWKDRSAGSLDGQTMSKFKDIETKLIGRLQGKTSDRATPRSQTCKPNSDHKNLSAAEEMPLLSTSHRPRKRNTPKNLRRNLPESESENSDIETAINSGGKDGNLGDLEDSEELYPNPMLDDLTNKTQSATDFYRSAISRIGSSANRRTSSQDSSVGHVSKSQVESQPLMFEDQLIDDDWLIDDMNLRPSKRRKMDVNGVFSTSSTRRKSEEGNKQKKQRKISDSDSNESLSLDLGVEINHENERTDRNATFPDFQTENIENTVDNDEVVIEDMSDLENFDTDQNNSLPSLNFNPTRNKLTTKRKNLSTRPRQLRMTNFGVRQEHQSQEIRQQQVNPISNSVTGLGTSTQGSSISGQSSELACNVMRVKVRVKDKLLLIPVSSSNCDKSIAWLSKETSQRYYSLCGLQPLLTLSTKDGAFLSPDDPISLVLSANEEIVGNVDNWDLPPLSDRYEQACKALNTASYRNIKTILESCDVGGYLKLCDLALRPAHIQPVFRALQCQNNLREINLQGNRIGDTGLDGFLKVSSTLPNLTILDLSCNIITAIGLKNIADCLSAVGNSSMQNLSTLSLSHNPLGDSVCQNVAAILSHLPSLTDLLLSSCEFTSKLFQQNRVMLEESISKSKLQNLDVSYNNFGSLGVELLLKSLNHRTIHRLDLTGNISSASPSHMLLNIQNFLSRDNCFLQYLDISDCHLNHDDCDFIIRLPTAGRHLQSLSLNRNPKLNNDTMLKLLDISTKDNSKLESLSFKGCGVKSPVDTALLDSICDKLSCEYPLKQLSFTCHGLDKVDKDSLSQIWTQQWRDNAVIVFTDTIVSLTVRDA